MKKEEYTYRLITREEVEKISEVDGSHYIHRAWRPVDGARRLVEINYEDPDFPGGLAEHKSALYKTIDTGGLILGAFDDQQRMAGFLSINREVFGEIYRYVLLDQLFVSRELRGKGIGRELFFRGCDLARSWEIDKLYICAGSAEDTLIFYRNIGCIEAVEINQSIYEEDPRDVQLEYDLNKSILDIQYRINQPVEAEELINVFKSVGWNKDSKVIVDAFNNSFYVLAYNDETLVGFARAISDGYFYTGIYDVVVDPGFQGRGIAKKLMDVLIRRFKGTYFFLTYTEGNEGFYEKCGFTRNDHSMWIPKE